MVRRSGIAALLPVAALALACATARTAGQEAEPAAESVELEAGEPALVGELSRAEIEAALPAWVAAEIEAAPEADRAVEMAASGAGSTVTVYLGTWCSDSRRELARFWRALDEAGREPAFELSYVGVDRDKREPAELLEGVGLLYVPTFVVEADGVERGRIVEESPDGIECDLAALLRGETSGVITAREELQ